MLTRLLSHINIPSGAYSCILCNTNTHQNFCLCRDCLHDLPTSSDSCPKCGNALPTQLSTKLATNKVTMNIATCGYCQTHKLFVDNTFSLFQYKMPIDYFIKQIKFHNSLVIADLLGKLMANHIILHELQRPDAIIPIPLHVKRLRQRGYNQALEIAKPLSKLLNIPILHNHLVRHKHTRPQTDCTIKERNKNITNSFTIANLPQSQTVAIVDDVITTGATINEAAKVLKQNGVTRVFAWSCAHTNLLK